MLHMPAINYIQITFVWAVMATGPLQATLTWDYLVFTQQWLPTLCSFKECVRVPPADEFTIHGLWPSLWPDKQPRDCPAATPFDRNKLKPILENLRKEWPDFLSAKDPDAFWEHEWYKHGRCAVEDELIKDELGYFNTSLNLHWKLPIMKLLAESGIHPSDSEPMEKQKLLDALERHTGVKPVLQCMKKHGEAAKLLEVRICFNPKLEMISCYQQGMNEDEIDIDAGRKIEGSMPCPDKLILPQHPES